MKKESQSKKDEWEKEFDNFWIQVLQSDRLIYTRDQLKSFIRIHKQKWDEEARKQRSNKLEK